ncbi:hypothetical protein BN2476_630149 [Paraburkholderia piptadeniae]|uniref:Uncharacterized protein n=1 Tax=Paraburkholderia piptadeniae TaxID=1701573 RepID=A0A1N7SLY0_9BURK|nr:hypothetical protein BN2476_630149 [Paraburkholderia piptadeniae]
MRRLTASSPGALLGPLARFLDAIRLTLDGDDLGAMHEAIDQGHDEGRTSDHAANGLFVTTVLAAPYLRLTSSNSRWA